MTTIDVTPTWSALLPFMLDIIENGKTEESKKIIKEQLQNMARVADLYVSEHKNEKVN